jgi:hypothetical protein
MKSGKRDYFYLDFENNTSGVDPTKTKSVWLYLFIVFNATFSNISAISWQFLEINILAAKNLKINNLACVPKKIK